jgi:hypothetical protein
MQYGCKTLDTHSRQTKMHIPKPEYETQTGIGLGLSAFGFSVVVRRRWRKEGRKE